LTPDREKIAFVMDISRRRFISLAGAMPVLSLVPRSLLAADSAPAPAFTVGDFKKIYDPSVGETSQWYINDHTFVRAEDGTWHLFGITHTEPANPLDEKFFAHATAPDLLGPWTKQAPVLQADPKSETLVWAPYCFFHEGLYYMYYCAGSDDHTKYKIHLATSKDLSKWERSPANPMIVDGFDARDPMVLQVDDQWILYYCATSTPQGGHHTVKAALSKHLLKWSDPIEVFRSPVEGSAGGPTESPFVVYREGKYYLFVCGENGYADTTAYVSDTPIHWDNANKVGKAAAHCAEIVKTPEGKWYISGAGWGQGGVSLAELTWKG
jgi:sucrose-6-phosphate hydrolase SacC (GH32 family)